MRQPRVPELSKVGTGVREKLVQPKGGEREKVKGSEAFEEVSIKMRNSLATNTEQSTTTALFTYSNKEKLSNEKTNCN